jgi:flavin-dependent dehydrogenase
MSTSYDLAIVGAGPAGAATALVAARAGWNVVVVDVAQFPRQKVCGEYLTPAAGRLLAELGLGELYESGVSLPTMQLTADDACRLSMEFDESQAPRSLSRYALDVRLVDAARRAGAVVVTGRRVRHVVVDGGRAVGLECAGDAEHEPGERIAARAIVAADGRRSVVVRDTGRQARRDLGLFGFKRHVLPASPASRDVIAMHALPGGYIGTCPTEDGLVNVCGVMPRRRLQAARGDVAAALDAWLVDRPTLRAQVAAEAEGPWHTMPDVSQQTARPVVDNVLYVGDAQGTIEPLTGQGMTMALAAARAAFETLERYGVDGVDGEAQAAYSATWRTSFASPIRSAAWFGRLLRRPALLKALIVAGRSMPGLTDLLLRGAHRRTLTVGAVG